MSETKFVEHAGAKLAIHLDGDANAPAVVFSHSILANSGFWDAQSALLVKRGLRTVRIDTRGHGASTPVKPPYTMDDLGADTIAVLDALKIAKAHFIGLSLGGMFGFGLGISHADRLLSLVLCDCRADTPEAMRGMWDERIAAARTQGTAGLAVPTASRWFGDTYLKANPAVASRVEAVIAKTSVDGFVGCAQAIQKLDYLGQVDRIKTPTTLIVGANDGPLPDALRDIQKRIAGSVLEVIADSGHIPNIDQPAAFDAAMTRHFDRVGS
jgi:3-oxoadipate enol-lactonase